MKKNRYLLLIRFSPQVVYRIAGNGFSSGALSLVLDLTQSRVESVIAELVALLGREESHASVEVV
jgi:hypothetical protein